MPRYKFSLEERTAKAARREQLLALMSQFGISGVQDFSGLYREMVGAFLEAGLEGELEEELGYGKYDHRNKETANSRNGHSVKSLKTSNGEFEIKVPRDRDGDFEPQLVKKHQSSLSTEIEAKIISLYAKGLTQRDIEAHIWEIYGLECSESTVSRVTDKVLPYLREWQSRPLEAVYAVMFLDAIHFHVRTDGVVLKKAVYVAIGITVAGKKDVLGMWVGENESAKFWATVLNSLKNRGVQDILIASVDGLTGFTGAIESVYPKTEVQQCIIHQLRNSTKYVSYKDIKALMGDLKQVYGAVDESAALAALGAFADTWDKKYPKIADGWRVNWANLSTYFKYPQEVRTLIYTTNAIEGFNRQLRKVTKSKGVFPTDDSLLKMLYLAMADITRKWKGVRKDWRQIRAQLEIFFPDRLRE
jgi:transposase-like protein